MSRRVLLMAVFGAFALFTLGTSVTQVRPGERAVVRRFGRILPDHPAPGLFVGLPWGIDRVDRVAVDFERSITVGLVAKTADEDSSLIPIGQNLTGDHNLVNAQAELQYRVIEEQVDRYVLQRDRVDALLTRAAEAAMADWVAGGKVDDILLRGKVQLPPTLIARVQERADAYGLGIRIQLAKVLFEPPAEVRPDFDAVNDAHTRIDTRINQARQAAKRKEGEAGSEKFRIEKLTRAYAEEQTLAARADAANFLQRLDPYRKLVAKDPDYLNTLWNDTMTKIYARMRETGRIDILDNYLSAEGLTITQFPLLPKNPKR